LARYLQLLVACTVLGVGVAFLLEAALGSDGYSSLVSGLTITTGWPFWALNLLVGAGFVAIAWLRGTRPGPGTVVSWFVVGFVISAGMALIPPVQSAAGRVGCLTLALVLMAAGVAGYLASDTGAGPAEAAALAWDPPVPFRWSYSAVQGGGALVGWLLGAAVGPGTLLVIVGLGPAVDLLRRGLPALERGAPARRTPPAA
jgi:uncharacterized protein